MENRTFFRVIVVAPTRSTCVNIHTVLGNGDIPSTLLMQLKGKEINDAVDHLNEGGFGVVAGTGTGKTVAIRHICRRVLGCDLTVDVVTREHEATEKTWRSNVLVVTPGVALNWLKSGKIGRDDLIVLDEVHQTGEHLELAMALAKRDGCEFVWMSATIDPEKYRGYLGARTVIVCEAFDPSRKAKVEVHHLGASEFLKGGFVNKVQSEKRGVAVFVPTRALAEELARECGGSGVHTDFYHGGESAEKLRPFLTGRVTRPFMVFMTIAGASSLNVVGLDTVVIVDQWFTEVVRSGGVKSLEKLHLGPNELLQMGGRVNGRAIGGRIHILSDRTVDFHGLKAVAPQFVLGGDLARVALTCGKIGVDARELDLIGGLDHAAYARVYERFVRRGIIVQNGEPHLTPLGTRVEAMPVEPQWAEVLAVAEDGGDRNLFNQIVVVACAEELYKLHRKTWEYRDVAVRGSDHLTSYNIVAAALRQFGFFRGSNGGSEYSLRGDWVRGHGENRTFGEFAEWCEKNGFVAKEIKNILLAMKSVYRQLHLELPQPQDFAKVAAGSSAHTAFIDLLAKTQSLDFVYREQNAFAGTVFPTQGGMASAYQVLGGIRYWTDRRGYRRASIEGTNIPDEMVSRYARAMPEALVAMVEGERVKVRFAATFAEERIEAVERVLEVDEVPEQFAAQVPQLFVRWLASYQPPTFEEWVEGRVPLTEELFGVISSNWKRQRQAQSLNVRAGENVFTVFSSDEIFGRFVEALSGARRISEVSNPSALMLPALDEGVIEKVLREQPDTITILGREATVEYRSGYNPRVRLDFRGEQGREWLKLPDAGIHLPGGREVVVYSSLEGYGYYIEAASSQFKAKARECLNQGLWEKWQKPELPAPTDFVSPIVEAEYGRCVVSDTPLVAYGAVNYDSWYGSWKSYWTRDRAEAERVLAEAKGKFVEAREKIARDALKKRVGELQSAHYYNSELPQEMRTRLYSTYYGYPGGATTVAEITAFIAEVEAAVELTATQKAEAERKQREAEARRDAVNTALNDVGYPEAHIWVPESAEVAYILAGKTSKMGGFEVTPDAGETKYEGPYCFGDYKYRRWVPFKFGVRSKAQDLSRAGNVMSEVTLLVPNGLLKPGVYGVADDEDGQFFFPVIHHNAEGVEVIPEVSAIRKIRPSQETKTSAPAQSRVSTDALEALRRKFGSR